MKKKLCVWLLAISVISTSAPMAAFAEEPAKQPTTEISEETDVQGKDIQEADIPETDIDEPVSSEEGGTEEQETEESQKETTPEQTEETEETETVPEQTEEPEVEDIIPQERTGSLEQVRVIEISKDVFEQKNEEEVKQKSYESSTYASANYKSTWDSYSSNYIYNQLNSTERAFWDDLDSACYYYLTQNVNAEVFPVSDEESIVAPKTSLWADFSYIGIGRAKEILQMFSYSNPQYYFLDSGVILTSGYYVVPIFYDDFQSGSARSAATSAVKSQIDAWMPQIQAGGTEVAKAKIAHDLIINKVQYDMGYYYGSYDNPFHQSAYSVFADDYTVCAGYTKAFTILMNGAGVDTIAVTSSDHAWNLININDSWYHLDCTWDDADGRNGKDAIYEFFCRSYNAIKAKEEGGQGESHTMASMYTGVTPPCTLDSNSKTDAIGTCYTPVSRTANPSISLKTVSGGTQVTLTCGTPNAEIYYTVNGTNPSSNYTRCYRYKGAFNVSNGTTVKAIAVRDTLWDSGITSSNAGTSYEVTFNSNGGSKVSTQYIPSNGTVKKPGNPSKSGYYFDGWYTDSKCTKAYNFSTKVTANTTLYAKWLKKYTVKFNGNGGSVKTTSKKVTYSKKYGTLPSPTRKGYSFSGWYTKKSGGTKITANSTVKITKTTTLYAHWKKISVKTTSISKLKNLSGKKLKVTAKKLSGVTGYQIRYSTKSNMKSAKKVTAKKNTLTASKLSKGKKYYVQVRAYKVDSAGKKVCGSWSKTKTIKIKK